MNNFKKLVLVAGFALLAACGNNSDKFVGVWIDPSPAVEKPKTGQMAMSNMFKFPKTDTIIKENGSNKVEVTSTVLGSTSKKVHEVDGANILGFGGRVVYTLEGDDLVTNSGLRLVRKK